MGRKQKNDYEPCDKNCRNVQRTYLFMCPLEMKEIGIIIYLQRGSNYAGSDSFTILGLWVLGLTVSNINESQLQPYESKTLFLMTSLQYYCIPGLAEIKTYAQKMQDAQVTKSLRRFPCQTPVRNLFSPR